MRSGTQVVASMTFTGMLLALLAPWIRWQVKSLQLAYPGVELPPGYEDQVQQFVALCLTSGVGIGHMLMLKLAQDWWPGISEAISSRGVRVKVPLSVIGTPEGPDQVIKE